LSGGPPPCHCPRQLKPDLNGQDKVKMKPETLAKIAVAYSGLV
jgi:hypothetical protein